VRRDGFRNRATLTFDLLTPGSMHAARLLYSIHVPSLMLTVQAVFLLQRGQTDRRELNALPAPVDAGNDVALSCYNAGGKALAYLQTFG